MKTMITYFQRRNNWSPEFDSAAYAQPWQPGYDVSEKEDSYLLNLELAGTPKDQIKIEVLDRELTVSGVQRRYGEFEQTFSLPAGLNTDKIEANYEDGVLQIKVPKSESARPRQIKIGASTSTTVENAHSGARLFAKLLNNTVRDKEPERSAG